MMRQEISGKGGVQDVRKASRRTEKRWMVLFVEMNKFLKFVHDDNVYCKYYEVIYILFHTGMRISEFCGLTISDIDLANNIVNIDHQLQRTSDMKYILDTTKTDAGTRKLPITQDVADCCIKKTTR